VELSEVIGAIEAHVQAADVIIDVLRALKLSGHRTIPARDASRIIAQLGVRAAR
jgi:hypothetical protein